MLATLVAAMVLALPDDARRWEDEIVYVVITEKFFDGDSSNNVMHEKYLRQPNRYEGGFSGGDLRGVADKLDDLADLGITTILLYPVMHNDERPVGKYLPTGYRPKDYESVDPNFGDLKTLRALIDSAHARKIRVILDMPITLPGFEHPFLADLGKKDWFGKPSQYGMPQWNVGNPAVADYLIGVCKRWKERSNCDGFRIDSAHLQPVSFWKRFVKELKAAPPAGPFVILPELTLNPREIGPFVADSGFDGAYDFSTLRVRGVFGQDEHVGQLSFIAHEAKQFYPSPRSMMGEIDNYEDAFASIAKEPKEARTKLALTWLLTIDRVPVLYAGNELGIAFEDVGKAFPPDRKNSPFLKDIKALIALRKREPALRHGDFTAIYAHESMFGFLRRSGEDRILVLLNGSNQMREFAMPIGDKSWKVAQLENLVASGVAKLSGGEKPMTIEPFGARILKVK